MAKGDLADEIGKLKNQDGGDIIVYGGANFVSSLIANDLIDEYNLFVNPAALGNGKAIFANLENRLELDLVESRMFECGVALLRYQPK